MTFWSAASMRYDGCSLSRHTISFHRPIKVLRSRHSEHASVKGNGRKEKKQRKQLENILERNVWFVLGDWIGWAKLLYQQGIST
eukprot:scaffold679441_cov76-Prasinocladus_malaysianus.AAC.1